MISINYNLCSCYRKLSLVHFTLKQRLGAVLQVSIFGEEKFYLFILFITELIPCVFLYSNTQVDLSTINICRIKQKEIITTNLNKNPPLKNGSQINSWVSDSWWQLQKDFSHWFKSLTERWSHILWTFRHSNGHLLRHTLNSAW